MIKVTENERYPICNSCGHNKNIKGIKVSSTGQGWTTIMLCEECISDLIDKLKVVL